MTDGSSETLGEFMNLQLTRSGALTCDLAASRVSMGRDVLVSWSAPHPNTDSNGMIVGAVPSTCAIDGAPSSEWVATNDAVVVTGDASSIMSSFPAGSVTSVTASLALMTADDPESSSVIWSASLSDNGPLRAGDTAIVLGWGEAVVLTLTMTVNGTSGGSLPLLVSPTEATIAQGGSVYSGSGIRFGSGNSSNVIVVHDVLAVTMDEDSESWGSDKFKSLVVPFQEPPR